MDCQLGLDNHIHTCLLGDKSQLFQGVKVKNSLLMDAVTVHRDTSISNTIIGQGATIGSSLVLHDMLIPAGANISSQEQLSVYCFDNWHKMECKV